MLLTLKRKNKKGFTLIELIVVVAILAILAAIAIPSFIGLQQRAQDGVDIANASSIAGAVNTYNALYPDGIMTGSVDTGKLEDANLWPTFTGDTDAALDRVIVSGTGVATVNVSIPFAE